MVIGEVAFLEALVGIFVRAMWAVMAASLPGALSRCRTAYPMVRSFFEGCVVEGGTASAVGVRSTTGGGCLEGLDLLAYWGFFSVGGPMRRKKP